MPPSPSIMCPPFIRCGRQILGGEARLRSRLRGPRSRRGNRLIFNPGIFPAFPTKSPGNYPHVKDLIQVCFLLLLAACL